MVLDRSPRPNQLMVMLVCCDALAPNLSVTVNVNVKVPAVVGVPSTRFPFEALTNLVPGGNCPAVMDQVYGVAPPLAKRFWKYALPTVPAVDVAPGMVITSVLGGLILMLNVLELEPL